ncbi:lactate racemase domain-containing protein [Treponema sp. OMZ 840]|uniref:lactate racemase domain-containing protein n=1 Tax=Treponema sp. OMZ 840 TaxID=244313 RepID=UPI003D93E16C
MTTAQFYEDLLSAVSIPRFVKVHQRMEDTHVENPYTATVEAIHKCENFPKIKQGDSVCIACGSREIAHLKEIVRAAVDTVKAMGGNPFLIPAMGSHGGATAEGQKEILLTYKLTEHEVGAPIRSSMETVEIGKTAEGLAVRIDKYAAAADLIILAARIKPHTDFRGPVESGIMKMISIGMGKQYGASICHSLGFPRMSQNVTDIANVVIAAFPKITGIGIIENAYHHTHSITVLSGSRISEKEPHLLEKAKSLMPKIPFEKCDALFVNEIGKNISGPGMDPNITGRSAFMGRSAPDFDGIAVFNLTEESHHNANGIGNADVTTERVYRNFDMRSTYANSITCMDPFSVKIPVVMPNDKLAMKYALGIAYKADPIHGQKVVWIRNTLSMDSYMISEGLLDSAQKIKNLKIMSEPQEVPFDSNGNIIQPDWT